MHLLVAGLVMLSPVPSRPSRPQLVVFPPAGSGRGTGKSHLSRVACIHPSLPCGPQFTRTLCPCVPLVCMATTSSHLMNSTPFALAVSALPSPVSSFSIRSRRDPPTWMKSDYVTFTGSGGPWTEQGLWSPHHARLSLCAGPPCCPKHTTPIPAQDFGTCSPSSSSRHRAGVVLPTSAQSLPAVHTRCPGTCPSSICRHNYLFFTLR